MPKPRPLAPHVQAAIARGAGLAAPAVAQPHAVLPVRTAAPHVQAAIGRTALPPAVQAKAATNPGTGSGAPPVAQPFKKIWDPVYSFLKTPVYSFSKTPVKQIDNSYGIIRGHGEVIPTVHLTNRLGKEESGSFDKNSKKIYLNENRSPRFRETTLEHELAHLTHSLSPNIDLNEPLDLLLSELTAKNRQAIKTLELFNEKDSPKTPDEKQLYREALLYQKDPHEFAALVFRRYAELYQARYFDINLTTLAKELLGDYK